MLALHFKRGQESRGRGETVFCITWLHINTNKRISWAFSGGSNSETLSRLKTKVLDWKSVFVLVLFKFAQFKFWWTLAGAVFMRRETFHDSKVRQTPPLKKYLTLYKSKPVELSAASVLRSGSLYKNEIQYTSFSYLHGSGAEKHKPVTKRAMMRFSLFVHTKIEVLDIWSSQF